MKLARATGLLLLAAALSAPLRANGAAHFDAFTEGVLGTTVVDGGITFSNLTNGFGGGTFCCENGTTDFAGFGGFTPPNALGFNGYSPGPGAGFSRVVSFELTTGQLENVARIPQVPLGGRVAKGRYRLQFDTSASYRASARPAVVRTRVVS